MEKQERTLGQLFVPICFEVLLYMLAGVVDTLMLSSVSDQAVGAVGTANTYIGMFIIMFSIITSGMLAVMTQNIGAGKSGVAYQALQIGMVFNTILGVVLGIFLFFGSGSILHIVGIADLLLKPADTYLKIVGGFCIFNALIPIFSGYLRAFGYTKQPLIATIIGNVLNFGLNALFLFVFHWGVAGVAVATIISKLLNLVIIIIQAKLLIHAKEDPNRASGRHILNQIIRIGLPSAMETALYNIAMTLVIRFLNQMDPDGLNVTARSYTTQITNFSYSVGSALAQANAILTGWRIGSGDYEACDKGTKRAALIGIIVATILEGIFALSGGFIMKLFSDDPIMIHLVIKLLAIDIVLEIGRVSNLVFGNALKAAGDVIFPMVIAAIFMYLFAVGGTYVFGIKLGLMAVGSYMGLAMDECVRAIGMFLRWRGGKWKNMSLVSHE